MFVEVVKRADQFGFQHHRHRIELVWAIQRDDRGRAVVGHENRIVVHGIGAAKPPGGLRPRPDALTLFKVAITAGRRLPRRRSNSTIQDVDGRLESHFLPEAQAHLVPHVRVQIDLFDATRPEPRERLINKRFPDSLVPLGRIDKQVVDVSVRSVLEDPRACEDCSQEEADGGPVQFGDEAEAVLVPDVAAGEAPPVSLPSGREAILRSTEIGVVVLELLPHLRERVEIRDPGDPDARLTGPDPRHPPLPAQRPRPRSQPHFPWNAGLRFSRNARKPSFASAIAKRRFCNSRSRAKPSYIGISRPSVTERLMRPTARAACCGYVRPPAKAMVSSQNFARGKMRFRRPQSSASFGVSMRPVVMRSIARLLPMSRGSRCVPPVPGRTPSVTSGNPSRQAPSEARRRSVAMAISSPPPTQCPSIAAMKSLGVLSILLSVSWQFRQNIAL